MQIGITKTDHSRPDLESRHASLHVSAIPGAKEQTSHLSPTAGLTVNPASTNAIDEVRRRTIERSVREYPLRRLNESRAFAPALLSRIRRPSLSHSCFGSA